MLFVGFAHNLLLESYVSRLGVIEKTHPGTDASMLRYLFLFKARQASERAKRLVPGARSATNGGMTAAAREKSHVTDTHPYSAHCLRVRGRSPLVQSRKAKFRT